MIDKTPMMNVAQVGGIGEEVVGEEVKVVGRFAQKNVIYMKVSESAFLYSCEFNVRCCYRSVFTQSSKCIQS